MSFIVKEIIEKKGMNDFFSVPIEIYRNDPNWIAPLQSEIRRAISTDKNPYFIHATLRIYVCYRDDVPVSRAILVINQLYWQKWNRKSSFFGFFESINDSIAVKCLFDKIEADSRASGAMHLEGPFNPNHYSELGILTGNHDSAPLFFETYNPDYYSCLLKEAGFSELKKLHTLINYDISSTIKNKFRYSDFKIADSEINVRKLNILRFRRDLEILREINNDAFDKNQFFLPLSGKEYIYSAKHLFFVSAPRLILIAEYKGKPVGAAQFVLNINRLIRSFNGRIMPWNIPGLLWNRRNLKELIVFTVAVKNAYRHTRVFRVMLKHALKIFSNYSTLATTWISDDLMSENLTQLLDLRPNKHFTIFSKNL
jgi:hypothetical protein